MRFSLGLITVATVLSPFTSAHNVQRDEAADIDAVKSILSGLDAPAFCSSFVPITDATTVATQTGTQVVAEVTITAPCTNPFKKRRQPTAQPGLDLAPRKALDKKFKGKGGQCRLNTKTKSAWSDITTTEEWISKWTTTSSTTSSSSTSSTSSSSTTSSTSTTAAILCSSQGLPLSAAVFACSVITDACLAVVTPKTVTVTTFQPGPTITNTVRFTPTCPITTTRNRNPTTTPATTTPATTIPTPA